MRSFSIILTFAYTFSFLFSFVQAQNWYPALPGKTQFFIQSANLAGDSTLHGFRTTFSYVQGLDSVFKFNEIARWVSQSDTLYDCNGNALVGGSFLLQFRFEAENVGGEGMIVKPNNEFWFYGPPADTFVLKTQFPTGDKWHFNGLDSAWIQSRTQQTIYGAVDSILHIQTDNGREFWLSQNHGFVEWDYFYPLLPTNFSNSYYSRGTIWAIEETQFGNHYPRFFDIWDLQPNDQFQYWGVNCGFGPCVYSQKYMRVNSANPQTNSISFGAESASVQIIPGPSSNDTIYYPLSPYNFTANQFSFFELLPGEYDQNYVLDEVSRKSQWNYRIKIQRTRIEIEDTCAKLSMYFEHTENEDFGEGLGRTGYNISDVAWNESETISCYHKVSDIWNGPCDTLTNPVTVQDKISELMGITLYPQPATDRLFLSAYEGILPNGELKIISANGAQSSVRLQSAGQTFALDLNGFSAGIYFLQILTDDGKTMSGRFILQQ